MEKFSFSKKPVKRTPVKTALRCIKTALPVPESLPMFENLYRNESRSMHGQMPVVWRKAKDFQVFDCWGNKWIDFTSGIFVANVGHSNDRIKSALQDVLDQELYHSYSYATEIRVQYLNKLVQSTPPELRKVYLVSTGTEATEMVMKLVRLQAQKVKKRSPGIMSFLGSYHGRTQGAAMVGGLPQSQNWIGYEDPNIWQMPFPYASSFVGSETGKDRFFQHIESLKKAGIDPALDIAGFMFEPFIGWAAAFIPKDYVKAAAEFAHENEIILAFDEVQGGFGRTGKLFTYQHYDVKPDLVACGKGISSSLPLGAVLGRSDLIDLPEEGSMSSTHSANPFPCAAGLASLQEIEQKNLVVESARKGKILVDRLNQIMGKFPNNILTINGKGLLAAVIFQDPRTGNPDYLTASRICERCMHEGVLFVHTGRESIKMGPPLTIPEVALSEGLDVFESVVGDIVLENGSHSK